jgi:hypothetical protein
VAATTSPSSSSSSSFVSASSSFAEADSRHATLTAATDEATSRVVTPRGGKHANRRNSGHRRSGAPGKRAFDPTARPADAEATHPLPPLSATPLTARVRGCRQSGGTRRSFSSSRHLTDLAAAAAAPPPSPPPPDVPPTSGGSGSGSSAFTKGATKLPTGGRGSEVADELLDEVGLGCIR